jgi:FixJ family two-component response regulator
MSDLSRWIAVVDDDVAVLKALGRLLRAHGLDAKTFASAQEFLAMLPHDLPQCLVLDLHMPDMGGLELQQHLARSGINLPIVIITANDSVEIRERCEAAGSIAFLRKPLQEAALFSAIKKAIGAADA